MTMPPIDIIREEWCPRCHRKTTHLYRGWLCYGCRQAEDWLRKHWLTLDAQSRLKREREWQDRQEALGAAA